ncbi:flocculation protein FLO11-like [Haliotis rufescens]|uniref:flocculation protein FLO11-like n=1 Tax=Haliotis rufescens TaxID=6454 RepID=UPI00201EF05F|nr:flocculation protein FLO11-like [Haliotis rufescens]
MLCSGDHFPHLLGMLVLQITLLLCINNVNSLNVDDYVNSMRRPQLPGSVLWTGTTRMFQTCSSLCHHYTGCRSVHYRHVTGTCTLLAAVGNPLSVSFQSTHACKSAVCDNGQFCVPVESARKHICIKSEGRPSTIIQSSRGTSITTQSPGGTSTTTQSPGGTSTTQSPGGPSKTTQSPGGTSTTTQSPGGTSPTTQSPGGRSTATQSPGGISPTTQSPRGTSTTTQSPGGTSTTTQSPGGPSTTTQSPGGTSTTTLSPGGTSPTTQSPGGTSPTTQSPGGTSPTTQSPGGTSPTTQSPGGTSTATQSTFSSDGESTVGPAESSGGVSSGSSSGGTSDGPATGTSYIYTYRHVTMSWDDARVECKKDGGDLMSFDTPEKLMALEDYFVTYRQSHSVYNSVWVGVRKNTMDGLFYWASSNVLGSTVTWASGHPSSRTTWQCGYTSPFENFVMRTYLCSHSLAFICETSGQ